MGVFENLKIFYLWMRLIDGVLSKKVIFGATGFSIFFLLNKQTHQKKSQNVIKIQDYFERQRNSRDNVTRVVHLALAHSLTAMSVITPG